MSQVPLRGYTDWLQSWLFCSRHGDLFAQIVARFSQLTVPAHNKATAPVDHFRTFAPSTNFPFRGDVMQTHTPNQAPFSFLRSNPRDTPSNAVYNYFDQKLRDSSYVTGDVYDRKKVESYQKDWDIAPTRQHYPYLKHVRHLSSTWPHLRLLADFMEIGTTPLRWEDLQVDDLRDEEDVEKACKERVRKRDQRATRTNVTRLEYMKSGEVKEKNYNTIDKLKKALEEDDGESERRLWVVEDLSRDVIEALGHKLDIEPAFFREHIVDYAWYNIRDRWADPPNLNMIARRQRWLQIRFVRARYFETAASFKRGSEKTRDFNVYRRLEDDLNNKAVWDKKNAVVGITRTRASFWSRSADNKTKKGAVGVLLLDPTIKEGTPLWHGYRNWETTPGVGGKIPCAPPQYSLFKDLIHWAQKPSVFKTSSSDNSSITHVPVQALLHLICAEWLTMVEYIKTRLSQIEWEVSMPEYFLDKGIRDDVMLKKLHFWRRVVPIYRELLTETIQRVSSFPCHTGRMGSMTSNSTSQQAAKPEEQQPDKQEPVRPGAINAFRDDFDRALSYMKEYQERIDRLTSVVTAMISIQDTRLSMQDARREQANNRNVARLTWLAMFFVPLSLVASLFSVQEDVGMLNKTFKLYFEVAFPVAAATLGLGFVFTRPSVQRLGSRIKKGAQIMKKEAHEEGSVRMKKWRQKKKKTKKQKRADDKV